MNVFDVIPDPDGPEDEIRTPQTVVYEECEISEPNAGLTDETIQDVRP